MAELLPCPFCGEKLVEDGYGNWEHTNNGCILSWLDSEYGQIFFHDHPDFIKAWNTRTPQKIVFNGMGRYDPYTDTFIMESEPQKINHDSLCETETFKVGDVK